MAENNNGVREIGRLAISGCGVPAMKTLQRMDYEPRRP
jgi:hypothetical protein